MEEVEEDLSQLKPHEDAPLVGDITASSSRTLDDQVNISFSHLAPTLGIALEGLVSSQTPQGRIYPYDESSTSTATTSLHAVAPAATTSSALPANQGGTTT